MRPTTRAATRSLITDYGLHDRIDGDSARVNLAPLEVAFPIKTDDLSGFDLAGMVVVPAGGDIHSDNPALVVIHSGLDDQQARLIYAHEVGHAILGHEGSLRLSDVDSWFVDRAEREAWQVAAQLLVPHEVVWAAALQDWSVDQVAAFCQVPEWLVEMYPR